MIHGAPGRDCPQRGSRAPRARPDRLPPGLSAANLARKLAHQLAPPGFPLPEVRAGGRQGRPGPSGACGVGREGLVTHLSLLSQEGPVGGGRLVRAEAMRSCLSICHRQYQ